jgi:hypothetical protein
MSELPCPYGVRATPGWSPVQIPGRPGWWRHCVDGQQVDLPHREPPVADPDDEQQLGDGQDDTVMTCRTERGSS